jgi:hypothetical protein
MIASFASNRIRSILGIIAILVGGSICDRAAAQVDTTPADDGWRRTVDGWEHISTWSLPAARISRAPESFMYSPALISADLPRSLFLHPALLAVALFGLGIAGLRLPTTVTFREPLSG